MMILDETLRSGLRRGWIALLLALIPATANADAVSDAEAQLRAPDAESVRAGIAALGATGDARAVPVLVARIEDGLPAAELMSAVGALVRIGGPRAHAALYTLCRHRNASVRAAALRGLVRTRAPRARAVVVGMLDDDNAAVRAAAVAALDELGPQGALDELLLLARRGQAEAAALLGRRASRAELRRLLGRLEAGDEDTLGGAVALWLTREDLPARSRVEVVERFAALGDHARTELLRRVGELPESDPARVRVEELEAQAAIDAEGGSR